MEKIKRQLISRIVIIRLYKEIFKGSGGEIDIIAKDQKTKELVFVEVKARQLNCDYSLNQEEALTSKKVREGPSFKASLFKLFKSI